MKRIFADAIALYCFYDGGKEDDECFISVGKYEDDEKNEEDIYAMLDDGEKVTLEPCTDSYYEHSDSKIPTIATLASEDYYPEVTEMNLGFMLSDESRLIKWMTKIPKRRDRIEVRFSGVKDTDKVLSHYVVTKTGKLALNPDQMESVHNRIIHSDLFDQVKARMNTVGFNLSQSFGYSHNFCNENVYGNFSFIMVHGFMRMVPVQPPLLIY